jgi:cytochrome c oxidase subunit 1
MPRRVFTYDAGGPLPLLNLIATCGSYIIFAGVSLFVANVIVSARARIPAGNDPWKANSLEWWTSSPPPEHNFDSLPPIRSERPVYDARVAARS